MAVIRALQLRISALEKLDPELADMYWTRTENETAQRLIREFEANECDQCDNPMLKGIHTCGKV